MFLQAGSPSSRRGLNARQEFAQHDGHDVSSTRVVVLGSGFMVFARQMAVVGALSTFGNDTHPQREVVVGIGGHDFGSS